MATTVSVSTEDWQETFISWLWHKDLISFLRFIIWHVFGEDLVQVTMSAFKPVLASVWFSSEPYSCNSLSLDMLKAVCPCLILLRKPPKACAGCLGFFKKSNLLNILNILRYILSVSSSCCNPSLTFRACPPLFFPFQAIKF